MMRPGDGRNHMGDNPFLALFCARHLWTDLPHEFASNEFGQQPSVSVHVKLRTFRVSLIPRAALAVMKGIASQPPVTAAAVVEAMTPAEAY